MLLISLLFIICLVGNIAAMVFAVKAVTIENRILALALPVVLFGLLLFTVFPMSTSLVPVEDDIGLAVVLLTSSMVIFFGVVTAVILSVKGLVDGIRLKSKPLILFSLLPVIVGLFFIFLDGFIFMPLLVYLLAFLFIMGRKVIRKWKEKGMKEVEVNEEQDREENQEPI